MVLVSIMYNGKVEQIPVKGVELAGNELLLKSIDKTYVVNCMSTQIANKVFTLVSTAIQDGKAELNIVDERLKIVS